MAKRILTMKHLAIMFVVLLSSLGSTVSAQVFHILGSGTTSNSSIDFPCPIGNYYYGDKEQYFVSASELEAIGILPGSTISSIGFNVVALNSCPALNNYQIKVFATTLTNPISSAWVTTGEVASSTLTTLSPVLGWNQVSLSTPFVWSGTDNLVIQVCMNNTGWTSNGNASVQRTNSGLSSSTTWSRWYRADASGVCGSTGLTSTSTSIRPNIRFEATPPSSGDCSVDSWSAGTASASPATGAPGASFSLYSMGASYTIGLEYQWQESEDGVSGWTDIPGATTLFYSTTAGSIIDDTTYYRLKITCTSTGDVSYSSVTSFTTVLVYCTPVHTTSSCTGGAWISNVTTTGAVTNITNPTLCVTGGYSDFTGSITMSAIKGTSFNISVTNGSSWSSGYKVWIDWNKNGIFDTDELAATTSTTSLSWSGTITVPLTAMSGTTRMRVRAVESSTTFDACSSYTYGEAEDYNIIVIALEPCSGTPVGGTANASPSMSAPSSTFNLNSMGASYAIDMEYQWQISDDGVSGWTDIPGATSLPYTATAPSALDVTTYYRLKMTCPTSGIESYSSVTSHTTVLEYCTPTSGTSSTNNYIVYVALNGETSITNSTAYDNYTNYMPTHNIIATQGTSVSFTIQNQSGSSNSYCYIWADWNHDGDFDDPGEVAYSLITGGGFAGTLSSSFTIPYTAVPGMTRIRIRTDWYNAVPGGYPAMTPCGSTAWGEVEDYGINVVAAAPCSGTPTGGTASASPSIGGPSSTFTLNASGYTSASGLAFQWQSSADGVTWTDISGATSLPYTATSVSTVDVTTYYRLKVTCTTSGEVAYSTETEFTTVLVYCTPVHTTSSCTGGAWISNVTTTGAVTNITNPTSCVTGGYSDFTGSITMSALKGTSFNINVTNGSSWSSGYKVWIDWNKNGTFETDELVASSSSTSLSWSEIITVPMSALDGTTTMRVRIVESTTTFDPCSTHSYGEAEDYSFIVISPAPCSGTPTGGTASASPSIGGPSSTFTLNASGYTLASGLAFQWQTSADGVTWTDISGATSLPYTATSVSTVDVTTYYRLKVTCTTSGEVAYSTETEFTTVISYCTPSYSSGCIYGDDIASFTLNGETSSIINPNTEGCPSSGYADLRSSFSCDAVIGSTYTGSISTNYSSSENVRIWIDFDNNGTFEPTESVFYGGPFGSGTPLAISITIPTSASPGLRTMRVRLSYSTTPSTIEPCTTYSYGETHDYSIMIMPPCSSPSALTLDDKTITTATVSWTEPAELPDVGYRVYLTTTSTAPDPLSATPAATYGTGVTTHTFTGLSASTTYYAWIVGDCGSAFGAITGPLSFTTEATCATPTSVGVSSVTHNSAFLGWPGVTPTPTEGYEYYLSTSSTAPTSSTPATGDASTFYVSLTGLMSSTTYYYWVRSECYPGEYSPWTVMGSFTTLAGCQTPTDLTASATSWNSATVSWTAPSPAPSGGYDYYYSTSSVAPTTGTTPSGSTMTTSVDLTGLSGSTTYYVWVRSDCGASLGESGWTLVPASFVTPLQNDDAEGAIVLSLGAGCTGSYSNATASVAIDEPFPSCVGTEGHGIVWFKFTAPASGKVKISNDYTISGGTAMGDSKIGLFEVGDPEDYSTFTILACDDNNGYVSVGKSVMYATDLTPGMDYYVAVSGKTAADIGDFCLTIDEMVDSDLSNLDDCLSATSLENMNGDFNGWLSIVDANAKLVAMVKPNAFGGTGSFDLSASQYIESGSVRVDSLGTPYLDRNITINNTGNTITDADVRLFFLDSELADLPGVSLASLGVSKYAPSSTCLDAYPSGIMPDYITPASTGSLGSMRYVEFNVTGFSSFFLHGGVGPLDLNLSQLKAENKGSVNVLNWSSLSEKAEDLQYIVERSDDGRAFVEIGTTPAMGKAYDYTYTDKNPVQGINYYRVKAVDGTNRSLYTNVAIAEVVVSNVLTAYPNPTKDVVNINIHQLGRGAKISVTDVHGRVLQDIDLGTQTQVQINLEAYAQGIYYIKYTDDATSQTFKVNKH